MAAPIWTARRFRQASPNSTLLPCSAAHSAADCVTLDGSVAGIETLPSSTVPISAMSWLMVGNVVLGRGILFPPSVLIPGVLYLLMRGETIGIVMVIGILLIDVIGLLYHRCWRKVACIKKRPVASSEIIIATGRQINPAIRYENAVA